MNLESVGILKSKGNLLVLRNILVEEHVWIDIVNANIVTLLTQLHWIAYYLGWMMFQCNVRIKIKIGRRHKEYMLTLGKEK